MGKKVVITIFTKPAVKEMVTSHSSKRNGDQSQKLKYTLSLLIPILAKNLGEKNYFHRYLSII